jgi:signal transduction histidine kinase
MLGSSTRGNQRLSWQLWASHFTVVVITLVALVGAIVLLAGLWQFRQSVTLREPALDAQVVGIAVGNLVRRGVPEPTLSNILVEMRNGGMRVPVGPLETERGPRWGGPPFRADLQNLDFVLVVTSDRRVLATSDRTRFPPGSSFPPPGETGWGQVIDRALSGDRDVARLSIQQANAPALGAYPIVDFTSDRPIDAVVVAKQVNLPRDVPNLLGRVLAAFGFATAGVLAASSVFALVFSGVAAYLLSRRLGGRLERLSRAADAVANGDLSQRVEPGPPDEVGRLAERFNLMAERLQESIAALEVEKRKAEDSLRTKRELVANVSHELRTPLASMRGHVESLAMAEGADPEQRRAYLQVIEREADHLNRLIDDLFALSTTEAGALPLKLEPLPLNEVVAEVADSVAPLARQERQVTLVNGVAADVPPVLADRQRLSQVLGNLLRNALRYTPEGGLISLSAAGNNGRVEVSVADTGIGIPQDELPHVFERFYRAGPARDRASAGAGLGLAIVRELVEAMGGEVSVESTEGEGSRFSFTLPVAGHYT